MMTSEALASAHSAKSGYARYIIIALLAGYTIIGLAGVLFWDLARVPAILSSVVPLGAALSAVALSLLAWRTLPRGLGWPWLWFAMAALLSATSHLVSSSLVVHSLWLASYAAILAGIAALIHRGENGRFTELVLDLGLMLTAATVVVVRWAPGAAAASRIAETNATLLLIVFAPVVALTALLLGAVLASGPRDTLPPVSRAAVVAAIMALAISAVPQAMAGESCCHAGAWTTFAAIGIWVSIAIAATGAGTERVSIVTALPRERLRQFVAPAVAIVLAAVSFEVALNPLEPWTAAALGMLGALVALRLSDLLNATRLQMSERRELARTRALVEVTRALAGNNELPSTLRIVTQWAARVTNAHAAAIELVSDDGSTLVVQAVEGLPESVIGMEFPIDASFTGRVILTGQPYVATNYREDPHMHVASLEFLGNAPVAAVPLRYRERQLGVLTCIGNQPFDTADLEMLQAFADQAAVALESARLFEQTRALAVTDPLTGLSNRRQLDRDLQREFAAARRGRRLVAVMFDLDDFKIHNDTYGHLAGDEVLRRFGEALRLTTRAMNHAARYGGDEFCALLADTDIEGTEVFAERVKERFYQTMEEAGSPPIHVSAGIAEFTKEMRRPEDLIEAADRALYVVKFSADVN